MSTKVEIMIEFEVPDEKGPDLDSLIARFENDVYDNIEDAFNIYTEMNVE